MIPACTLWVRERRKYMPLSGNTGELSLADLILVKAMDSRSYRLSLSGPSGDGLMFIEAGRIVHAAYGELPPQDAAYLLVTEQDVEFLVESDAEVSAHTLELGPQELLMEAMRRLDEGQLRKPPDCTVSHDGLCNGPSPRATASTLVRGAQESRGRGAS